MSNNLDLFPGIGLKISLGYTKQQGTFNANAPLFIIKLRYVVNYITIITNL